MQTTPGRIGGTATITVAIADDDPLVCRFLTEILHALPAITVVGHAPDGAGAVRIAAELRPDVILMDLAMPQQDGLSATREILQSIPNPPRIIAMTALDLDERVAASVDAGAHSFLSKAASPEQFELAIRAAMHDTGVFSLDAIRRLATNRSAPRTTAALPELTDRERETLTALGTGATNRQIAAQLMVSEATVKTHVSSILMKIGVVSRVEAAVIAAKAGLLD